MMKRLFTLLSMMLVLICASAQDEKTPVCMGQFQNKADVSEMVVNTLRTELITGINNKGRLTLVDITTLGDSVPTSKNEMLKFLGEKGIQFLIEGSLNAVTCNKGEQYYSAEVNYSLTVIETETGVTKATESYKDTWSTGDSGDDAIMNAIGRAKSHMSRFVEDNFRLEAFIKELDQVDAKKGAKTCYISLGRAQGIAKGQILEVFARVQVAGEQVDKKIGELKAREVMSETLTLCDVKDGGKEIQSNYEKNIPLKVVSRPQKQVDINKAMNMIGI